MDAADTESARQQADEAEVRKRAKQPGTAFWRLTEGRGGVDDRSAAGRVDFVLQDSPTENPYLSAISSHFGYWSSPDTALLLARAVSGLDVLTGRPKHLHESLDAAAGTAEKGQQVQQGEEAGASGSSPAGSSPKSPQPTRSLIGHPKTPLSPQELVDRAWQASGV